MAEEKVWHGEGSQSKFEPSPSIRKIQLELNEEIHRIIQEIPEKITSIQLLLNTKEVKVPDSAFPPVVLSSDDAGTKNEIKRIRMEDGKLGKYIHMNGVAEPSNSPQIDFDSNLDIDDLEFPNDEEIFDTLEKVTTVAVEFKDLTDNVILWLHLQMPKIETGNTFRAEVLEELCLKISALPNTVTNLLYLDSRIKMKKTFIKYPDARMEVVRQVNHADWAQRYFVNCDLKALLRSHIRLYDLLMKNWEVIQAPSPSSRNTENMMY